MDRTDHRIDLVVVDANNNSRQAMLADRRIALDFRGGESLFVEQLQEPINVTILHDR
jgi:hypothetical protein